MNFQRCTSLWYVRLIDYIKAVNWKWQNSGHEKSWTVQEMHKWLCELVIEVNIHCDKNNCNSCMYLHLSCLQNSCKCHLFLLKPTWLDLICVCILWCHWSVCRLWHIYWRRSCSLHQSSTCCVETTNWDLYRGCFSFMRMSHSVMLSLCI